VPNAVDMAVAAHGLPQPHRRFTPAVIDHGLCLARTWNNAKGGQCGRQPLADTEFCRGHVVNQRWQVHGRVDGPIPEEKFEEFMKARPLSGSPKLHAMVSSFSDFEEVRDGTDGGVPQLVLPPSGTRASSTAAPRGGAPRNPALEPVQGAQRASDLIGKLGALREERLFCDVAFVVGGQSLFAHQVLLACACPAFRECFAGGSFVRLRPAGPLLPAPPESLELQLDAAQRPEAMSALLDHAYSGGSSGSSISSSSSNGGSTVLRQGPPGSSTVRFEVACQADGLLQGMQAMRAQALLCDLVISAGGRSFVAHQSVLAAASASFRDYVLDDADGVVLGDVGAAPGGAQPLEVVQPLELELTGVTHGEAVGAMLDAVYGALDVEHWSRSLAANMDLLALARAFELPWLATLAQEWLRKQGSPGVRAIEGAGAQDVPAFKRKFRRVREEGAGNGQNPASPPLARRLEPEMEAARAPAVGSPVRLKGLKSRTDFNGLTGICEGWDSDHGRWVVRLRGGPQDRVNVKPENLELSSGIAAAFARSPPAPPGGSGPTGAPALAPPEPSGRGLETKRSRVEVEEARASIPDPGSPSDDTYSGGCKRRLVGKVRIF